MNDKIEEGVKMLIERMQTNPEDFDYGGRLYEYTNMIGELFESPKGHQRLWYMTDAEKKELISAYTDMHRTKFTAGVVHSIFSPEPEEPSTTKYTANLAKSVMNTKHQVINNILRDEFDKAYAKNRNT